jgi:hypothetical protein
LATALRSGVKKGPALTGPKVRGGLGMMGDTTTPQC